MAGSAATSSELFTSRRWIMITAAIGISIGIAYRFYAATHQIGILDADEAITGLMARHALDGEWTTFYWGQNYGGALEAFITAAVFAVFDSSVWTLRAVPTALFVAAAVVNWRIGLRLGARLGAVLAGVLFLIWPGWIAWKSLKAHAFYGVLALGSALVILLALQIYEERTIPRYAVLGLVIGLGWWSSPQIALIAVPAIVWLLIQTRDWRLIPIVGLGIVVGAAPWLIWNATNDWASIPHPPDLPDIGYADRLKGFWTHTLPMALALRAPGSGSWLTRSDLIGYVGYGIALAAFLWFLYRAIRQQNRPHVLFAGVLFVYPYLYAASAFTWYVKEPRYLVPLLVVASLMLGLSAARSIAVMAVVIGGLLPVSGLQLIAMEQNRRLLADVREAMVPADITPLIDTLEEERIVHVLADYWLAYRISFESRERVIGTSTTHVRYVPHDEVVRADPSAAFVFTAGAPDESDFLETTFDERPFRKIEVGKFVIYEPEG